MARDRTRLTTRLPLVHVRGHAICLPALSESALILDLGANHGEFSRALGERLDNAEFRLYEANPALVEELRDAGFVVQGCAVSDRGGGGSFPVAANDEGSSLSELPSESAIDCIEVATVTVKACPLAGILDATSGPVDLIK